MLVQPLSVRVGAIAGDAIRSIGWSAAGDSPDQLGAAVEVAVGQGGGATAPRDGELGDGGSGLAELKGRVS